MEDFMLGAHADFEPDSTALAIYTYIAPRLCQWAHQFDPDSVCDGGLWSDFFWAALIFSLLAICFDVGILFSAYGWH
jgi:hypothetical protein